MRVAVIQLGETDYEFIWSHHHILLDGWCMGILISEFFQFYKSHLFNRESRLLAATPYRNYIEWLERRNQETAREFWSDYLKGYREAAQMGTMKYGQGQGQGQQGQGYKREQVIFTLDEEYTLGLNEYAGRRGVTVNTVVQLLWGILLARYTGKQDVVFGSVVSGRPSGLEGVETMVDYLLIQCRFVFAAVRRFLWKQTTGTPTKGNRV